MKTFKAILSVTALGALMAIPFNASARGYDEGSAEPSVYLGAGAGYNRLDGQPFDEPNDDYGNFGDSRATWKGFVGVQFTPLLAVEGQYIDFGTHDNEQDNVQAHGWGANLVLNVPIAPGITPFAKVGTLSWTSDGMFTTDGTPNGTGFYEKGTDLSWGGGINFRVARNVEVRAEYERFRMADARVDNATIALKLNF